MSGYCWTNIHDVEPALNRHKWNESGFRPPLCTYRLNWARRTSWGWWDDWDDTVLQTQNLKFVPRRSEAEHATSRSRRLPTILTFTRGWGRNIFVSFKLPSPGTEPRALAWKAAVLTTTLGHPPTEDRPLVYNGISIVWNTFKGQDERGIDERGIDVVYMRFKTRSHVLFTKCYLCQRDGIIKTYINRDETRYFIGKFVDIIL